MGLWLDEYISKNAKDLENAYQGDDDHLIKTLEEQRAKLLDIEERFTYRLRPLGAS